MKITKKLLLSLGFVKDTDTTDKDRVDMVFNRCGMVKITLSQNYYYGGENWIVGLSGNVVQTLEQVFEQIYFAGIAEGKNRLRTEMKNLLNI